MRSIYAIMLLTVLVTLLAACGGKGDGTTLEEESTVPVIAITSPAFLSGEPIPAKYAKGRETLSPPLEWGQPPEGTQSLALICDDPDAPGGTWVHWVIYNLPPTTRSLPEGVSRDVDLADGSHNGKNSWGNIGYDGPSPPGGTHRYYFKLYAIDTMLDLDSGATKKEVLEAIEGHLLARGELMGTYKK